MSSDSCNSRHLSWIMKSCFPNPQQQNPHQPQPITAFINGHHTTTPTTTISSLPDDLLLECLTRVSASSISSLCLVCRRWSLLFQSPSFYLLRRLHGLLHPTIFALSPLSSATLRLHYADSSWKIIPFPLRDVVSPGFSFSQVRIVSIGHQIYILSSNANLRFDTWTGKIASLSPMLFRRKKFAAAVIAGKIYVSGGVCRMSSVEVYDPEIDKWSVVSDAPRGRYGCIGASVEGVFYVIGGLKIDSSGNEGSRASASAGAAEAHLYASTMDLYDVEARGWMRSRAVPGGGCVVAACAALGNVYVLASHALELSFWRFEARRNRSSGGGGGGGFGEWCRLKSPPLRVQVRVGRVRFSCVDLGEKVVLIQVMGFTGDVRRRSVTVRSLRDGLVLVYDIVTGEWSRAADLPEAVRGAACVSLDC